MPVEKLNLQELHLYYTSVLYITHTHVHTNIQISDMMLLKYLPLFKPVI